MLTTLRIKNLALVADLTLELQPHANSPADPTFPGATGSRFTENPRPKPVPRIAVSANMPTDGSVRSRPPGRWLRVIGSSVPRVSRSMSTPYFAA